MLHAEYVDEFFFALRKVLFVLLLENQNLNSVILHYATERKSIECNGMQMINSWEIFHAENDAVNSFPPARHNFEYTMTDIAMQSNIWDNHDSIRVSIWLHIDREPDKIFS